MSPAQKPNRSKQDYGTPPAFVAAVEARFGRITFDLAASRSNRVRDVDFLSEQQDSLALAWPASGNLWLNPPFGNIDPWAKKCAEQSLARRGFIFLLTPASIGCKWFDDHVKGKAFVLGLLPRLSFDGKNPYPKDLSLSVFGFGLHGFDTWRWK